MWKEFYKLPDVSEKSQGEVLKFISWSDGSFLKINIQYLILKLENARGQNWPNANIAIHDTVKIFFPLTPEHARFFNGDSHYLNYSFLVF